MVTVVGLIGAAARASSARLAFAAYRVIVGSGGAGTVSAFALVFGLLGVQLLLIALLGEYVGGIYTESKARPYYVVRDVHRSPAGLPSA